MIGLGVGSGWSKEGKLFNIPTFELDSFEAFSTKKGSLSEADDPSWKSMHSCVTIWKETINIKELIC